MKRKSISDRISQTLNNEDGAALITVLVIFLTLVIIVTSASQAALGNFMRTKKSSDHSSVIYLAEAGLYKYDEPLQAYLVEKIEESIDNKEDFEVNDKLIEDFIDSLFDISDPDHFDDIYDDVNKYAVIDYGTLMNEKAKAHVSITYLKDKDIDEVDNVLRYIQIKSLGYLGKTNRTVSKEYEINMSDLTLQQVNVLQPGGIVAVDTSEDPVDFVFPQSAGKAYALDSLVTNQRVIMPKNGSLGKLRGPLVTNNEILFNLPWTSVDWQDGMIITSNIITIPNGINNFNTQAIIFKPHREVLSGSEETGYKYEYKYDNTYINSRGSKDHLRNTGVKYIYIPEGQDENNYFRLNGEPSIDIKNKFIGDGTVIVKYNPDNFNPYRDDTTPPISARDKELFFGQDPETVEEGEPNPKLDFRQYFESDFILDNLHRETIIKRHKPTVKLPDRKKYTDLYTDLKPLTSLAHNGVPIIDNDNNLNFSNSRFSYKNTSDYYELDLSNISRSYGSKTMALNSLKIGGASGSNMPMRINVGDEKITLVTKKLDFSGYIEVVADKGSLEIVVIGENGIINNSHFSMNYGNISIVDSSNTAKELPSKLRFVVYETATPISVTSSSNGNNFNFRGTIFSENLNIAIKTGFQGNFISARGTLVKFPNVGQTAASQLIYAPEATLDLAGGEIVGVVIVNNYKLGSAEARVEFDSDFMLSLMDEIDYPIFDSDDLGFGEGSIVITGDANGGAVIEVNE